MKYPNDGWGNSLERMPSFTRAEMNQGVTAEYPSTGSYNPEKAGYMDTQLSPANALRTRNTCMSYSPCVC